MKQSRNQAAYKYAKALFEVANERKELATIFQEIKALQVICSENERLTLALSSRTISKKDRFELLDTLKKPFSDTTQNFLSLLSDYNRLAILPIIIDSFIALYDEQNGILEATVTTTYPLETDQLNALKDSLKKRFDSNEINIKNDINSSIMGGAVIRVGDQIIDGSIQRKLSDIKKILLEK
ncbi:ATP synthase subunit delta [Companilactobacillus sp. RD055328]|uniref:ATP synthase F1 subunit delta n=1 Tax=Companilactobacillus sp. RD055328 TaxID=2916634 RepID=UPI001FC86979|nr:ATP synthase F1 subunit delta [Companilactobacillus sp. RD055328]GKQ42884.1 ATP synthase subunit delta [Companilactobacillus sp. RD055328]